jgi:UDP-N-acetyl-D-glucosamine dehydrogenase
MEAMLALAEKIVRKSCLVGIIGLGYVGLPLARTVSQAGYSVLGFDIDAEKISRLQRGDSYIRHIDSDALGQMHESGFRVTDQFERLGEADAILICVPTPLTDSHEPDLQYVVNSTRAIAACLRRGQLVVLESTSYPGTTRGVVLPILEATGLRAGQDFALAFSPEREDPGNPIFATASIPKVVSGCDALSLQLASSLYNNLVIRIVPVSSLEVAEACKLLENTYRAVNIALVNELKVLFHRMGIDVWEVIQAAETKPFGFQPFYPGPGLGGHCIPIDPYYLAWVAKQHAVDANFIELAGNVNTAMPNYVIERVGQALDVRYKRIAGSRIALLGMAYKKNVDDPRESPGIALLDLLLKRQAEVSFNDPYISELPPMRRYPNLKMSSQPLTEVYLQAQDCVLIVTDHSAYDWDWIVRNAQLLVDTRNATRNVRFGRERIVHA